MSSITEILISPVGISLIILSVAVIVLLVMVIRMYMKLQRFLIGINADHIGNSIDNITEDLSSMKTFRNEIEIYLTRVEKRLRKSVKSVHTVRFNPWHGGGEGGNQSFATAFMNEDGDGVLISSLYSREHVSVFGKPLTGYTSTHELSDEEKKAVEEARKSLE